MLKSFVLSIAFLLIGSVFCEEDIFVRTAKEYLQKHQTAESEKKWEKKWKQLCETAMEDTGKTEEDFINTYVLDWLFDRQSAFEKKQIALEDKLTICRLFLVYKNITVEGKPRRPNGKAYKLPDRIEENLTPENLNKCLQAEKELVMVKEKNSQ